MINHFRLLYIQSCQYYPQITSLKNCKYVKFDICLYIYCLISYYLNLNLQKLFYNRFIETNIFSPQHKLMNRDILDDLDDLSEEQSNDNEQNQLKQNQQLQAKQALQFSQLLQDETFLNHIAKVQQLINKKIEKQSLKANKNQSEHIHQCNIYAAQINLQIQGIMKFVKKIYNQRFPELQSIVPNSSQYCKALLEIQTNPVQKLLQLSKETDPNKKAFKYLTSHQRISLSLTISAEREPIPQAQRQKLLSAANTIGLLQQHHNLMMMYLQSCMQIVAPNLCKLVGSSIASKLISAAGGIDKLAMMPACNIQVMGGTRSAQIGLSMLERHHTGIFGQMDVVRDAPKKFQMQLVRMLATNTAKCARADFLGKNNGQGDKLRQQMLQRFQKIQQQGGLNRIERPLPVPDEQPKKKRGGKKHRKMKELYQMTELRKKQNQTKFGQQQQQQIGEGVGVGMLMTGGFGKTKIIAKQQKLNPSKKMMQRMNKKSGLQSSLDFGSKQGIELVNPAAIKQMQQRKGGTESYFNRQSGFKTVLNEKLGK